MILLFTAGYFNNLKAKDFKGYSAIKKTMDISNDPC
jgi:hypothetical protein